MAQFGGEKALPPFARIGLRIARIAARQEGVSAQTLISRQRGDQPMSTAISGPKNRASSSWSARREASLNWLAFGLLLAAWNASDNDAAATTQPRPEALRGYAHVSVRAAQRIAPVDR
jgi:hypothetical protein